MTTYELFASTEEALDSAIHGQGALSLGREVTAEDDAAAIELARSGGWAVCLGVDLLLPTGYFRVWTSQDDE